MKCAVNYGKEDVRIEERPALKANPGSIVIRMDFCGVCGTDVDFFKRGIAAEGSVSGHEILGTVTEVGEGVAGYEAGDQIIVGPPSRCPDNCPSCARNRSNICINGWRRSMANTTGGYAEYLRVNDPAHTSIVKVPEGMDPKIAVLYDVVCVAIHGIRLSKFQFGDNVVVSGTGSIGIAMIRILKAAGARKIVALGTTESKYPMLKKFGADICINPNTCGNLKEEIRSFFGAPVGGDIVFECAGNLPSLKNCIFECVKPGGQVVVLGTIEDPLDLVPAHFSVLEIDMQMSIVYTLEDMEIFVDMVTSGKLDFDGMITDVIALDDLVVKGLARDRKGQIKILVDPGM